MAAHPATPVSRTTAPGREPADRLLAGAAVVFTAGFLFHNADHVRRGTSVITAQVFWGGMVVSAAAVLAIVLVVMRHRLAPLVATVVGSATALAVVVSHLLPYWSSFSDPFVGSRVSALSWSAAISELVGSLVLAGGGAYVLARRDALVRRRPSSKAG